VCRPAGIFQKIFLLFYRMDVCNIFFYYKHGFVPIIEQLILNKVKSMLVKAL